MTAPSHLPPSDSLRDLLTGDWTGFIAALPGEAATLASPPPNCNELIALDAYRRLVVSGIGPERAEQAARSLVTLGARALISWGTAGGLNPDLKPGTLLLCPHVVTEDGRRHLVDADWQKRFVKAIGTSVPTAKGALFGSRDILTSVADKAAAYARTGAQAVDMESAAIALVAAQNRLPLLIVRVIVDTAADALPTSALAAIDEEGRTRPLALMLSLARRPADMTGLIHLGARFARAKMTLRTIAENARSAMIYR
jgi:adenosylhomocysteine nucleosidase